MSNFRLAAAASLAAVVLAPSLFSQHVNTSLLQNWKRGSARSYSDVWGWTAPDGKEFAIIGDSAGISILDATDPTKVKSLGFYAVSASGYAWRDYTNLGKYFYAVSEHHRGMRVFEMLPNGTPKDHGFVQTATVVSAHNIRCDPDTGYLYVTGGNNRGLAIFDASTTPTNPKFLSVWNSNYVHDACIRRGKAYVCTGSAYVTRILNIRNPSSIPQIGQCATTSGYNHSAWISEDDKILCICHESARGSVQPHMQVWDVSNPSSPLFRGIFEAASRAIVHNVFVIGRTAYMSYYIHGFQMADLSDPTNPTKIASFSTSSYTTVGYYGAWGCYPFQDSGVIYINDMQNGFFALRVNCGHINRFGTGTAGPTGVPRARFDGATPKVGASKLRFEVENLEPSKPFWVVVSAGAATSAVTALGAKVHVDLSTATILGPLVADANGKASVPSPVPNNSGLGNAKVYFQMFSQRGTETLSSSRGMWAGICK